MATTIAVVAESGFGKSTSMGNIPELNIQGLDPKETFLINIKGKALPFKGWRKNYTSIPADGPPVSGNYLASTSPKMVIAVINYINTSRPDIKTVVLDDYQYVMAEEFMANALKSGYDKFNKMAKNAFDVINAGIKMSDNKNFIVLTHSEPVLVGTEASYKIKTLGKMLDDKVTLEGLFTIVLYGKSSFDGQTGTTTKQFVTNFDGQYPAKSPVGMFSNVYIPNDLGLVLNKVNEYNHGE